MLRLVKDPTLPVRVAVHDGSFHADDVLCAAMVCLAYGADQVELVRTRDPKVWDDCAFVLDVGECDDVTSRQVRLDHHQRGSLVRESGVKAAACGKLADLMFADEPELLDLMRAEFLDAVEAEDNGQEGVGTHLFSYVFAMNRRWDEPEALDDRSFAEAVAVTERILGHLLQTLRARLTADRKVTEAIDATYADGIVELDRGYPWADAVVAHNASHPTRKVLLVVYPSKDGYSLQVVPKAPGTFEAELDLPAPWAGLRDAELAAVTGIPGAIFCHVGRFLAVFRTREEALGAARLALPPEEEKGEGHAERGR